MVTAGMRPTWRGHVHQWAFVGSLPVGLLLVGAAHPSARWAIAIYAISAAALLGTSALYHRVTWSPRARRRMRRIDHAMIFVVIAGAYTPWGALVLSGRAAEVLLAVLWVAAAGGATLRLVWLDAPKRVIAASYVVVGLLALGALPAFLGRLGPVGTGLVALAGALAVAGAVVYATERPDPRPATFGYHEVFHVLVVAALAAHTAAVALYAL